MLQNQIAVHHLGRAETRLVNRSGPAIGRRAVLQGLHTTLQVDGATWEAENRYTDWGEAASYIVVDVGPGEERVVKAAANPCG